ncbi:MAG: glucose-6-phosphate isomerase [Spirochaeta sp. LUC14_002_19_P3]|nr:MAG: glucose-6-phosphate isomerase [Spirochaeta sp. LUC14_002_19_P3]
MRWNNMDKARAYRRLRRSEKLPNLAEVLNAERMESWVIPGGGGLDYYYGASLLTPEIIDNLQALANEQQLVRKYLAMVKGEKFNTGENRRVLHHLTRGNVNGRARDENGFNIGKFYRDEYHRISQFVKQVYRSKVQTSWGLPFDNAVQIGIGGSDLGPRALALALQGSCEQKFPCHFVSNVDPHDVLQVRQQIDPSRTLVILVTKSGTTQETLANHRLLNRWIKHHLSPDADVSYHTVAITSQTSPLVNSKDVRIPFYIDDNIGGRFSSTSAVGALVLSLAYGPQVFEEILAGAHEADMAAREKDIRKNAALMDAMIGVYNRNILGMPATAILPYAQSLARFPAHLQQLDMESNGKSVNRFGEPVNYPTGPIIFGEPGTNGQHSFYQLLHQGTDIIPLQFIGFRQPPREFEPEADGMENYIKLNANLAAQIIAFAKGRKHENANKNFNGGRPSTILVGDKLTPRALGALLAHYENKIMFQGFCWNINSFDQEGVQLGKILTDSVLAGTAEDETLKTCAKILGIDQLGTSG